MIPVNNPTVPFWLLEPSDLADHCSTAELPKTTDILIIGAGYTGAAAAYSLVHEQNFKGSVTLLEARSVSSGATGRNGGHMRPDLYASWATYEREYGVEVAAELARFELQGMADAKKLIERENIDCELEITRSHDVYLDQEVKSTIVSAFRDMERSKLLDVADFELIEDPVEAEEKTCVKGALGAIAFTSGHCWPAKLVTHLIKRATDAGVNLQTHTPVHFLSKEGGQFPWLVTTERGAIRAKKVIVASNGYTARLLPMFQNKIVPVRGIACHIAPPAGEPAPALKGTYCIRHNKSMYDYLIQRHDGSIIVGGAKQAVLRDRGYWYNNTNDAELIPGVEDYYNGFMQRTFTGWETSDAAATRTWTGIMGYGADDHPYVGPVPGMPGVFVAAGFTGHGMPRCLGCGRAVAQLASGTATDIAQTGIPRAFWTSPERMALRLDDQGQLVTRLTLADANEPSRPIS